MSASAARSWSSCRAAITTSAPASASPRAIALPSPLFPPVTRAALPVRSNSGVGTGGPSRGRDYLAPNPRETQAKKPTRRGGWASPSRDRHPDGRLLAELLDQRLPDVVGVAVLDRVDHLLERGRGARLAVGDQDQVNAVVGVHRLADLADLEGERRPGERLVGDAV